MCGCLNRLNQLGELSDTLAPHGYLKHNAVGFGISDLLGERARLVCL